MDCRDPWEQYTSVLKALSDPTRLKILWLLCRIDSKICASEIAAVLGESAYNISRHVKVLRTSGLIYEKKEGKRIFYYYNLKDAPFNQAVQNLILRIPDELMTEEILRCRQGLENREKL